MNPRTTVVGFDGSPDAAAALRWAAEQATLQHGALTIVHAVRPLTGYELGALAAYNVSGALSDELETSARVLLLEAVGMVTDDFPDLSVNTLLVTGAPEQELVKVAAGAECLVVGSRGRGRAASLLLGSVSAHVADAATVPVVVVRPSRGAAATTGVLVGTDCTENSLPTLEFAYRQASLRGTPLTVVYALYEGPLGDRGGQLVPDDAPGLDQHRAALAESIAGLAEKFPDVQVRQRLGHGRPDTCLVANSSAAALVVVGHHRASSIADIAGMGSYALGVVERAEAPVAVVFSPARH